MACFLKLSNIAWDENYHLPNSSSSAKNDQEKAGAIAASPFMSI
jgi:hypothetical protein